MAVNLRSVMNAKLPDDTARVARTPLRQGNFYRAVGDQLAELLADTDFSGFPHDDPAVPADLLAMVTIFQYIEGVSDPQAVEAVRRRIDWKYALHLPLGYPGFDHLLLLQFRHWATNTRNGVSSLEHILVRLRELGFGWREGTPPKSASYLLTSVRTLNRLLLIRRAMCLALEAIVAADPEWLKANGRPHWGERYCNPQVGFRPPYEPEKREALALAIGADAHYLLDAVNHRGTASPLSTLPAMELLLHVWRGHFESHRGEVKWRSGGESRVNHAAPSDDRYSPRDAPSRVAPPSVRPAHRS